MYRYVSYDLENIEDIKISKTMNTLESEESLSYIPGTSLRGAYIYEYIKTRQPEDINKSPHREKLLLGEMEFLNAYPVVDGKRSIPLPKCYFAKKDDLRTFEDELDLKLGLDESLPMGYKKVRLSEFVGVGEDGLYKSPLEKGENLHINKQSRENILYRYEYIKRGQKFRGLVKLREEDLEEFRELFENKTVYIGGSKGSGYGRCFLDNFKLEETNPESLTRDKFDGDLYILAVSDIVYRNCRGMYSTELDLEELEEELDLKLKFEQSSIDTVNVSNFNNKWGCRTPNLVSIGKGSVYKYSYSGELDLKKLRTLIDKGLGHRKVDGFGRIDILSDLDFKKLYSLEKEEAVINEVYMNKQEKKQLMEIYRGILEGRLDLSRSRKVLDLAGSFPVRASVKNAQMGHWMTFFENLSYLEADQGKKKYRDYMDHLVTKNSTAYNQLKSIRGLQEYMEEFVDKSDNIEVFEKENKSFEGIEDIRASLNSQDAYVYNMKIMSEYFRYNLRREEK